MIRRFLPIGRKTMRRLAVAALLAVPVVLLVGSPSFKNLPEHGRAPLHQAAIDGDLPTVELLIAGGGDVNAKDRAGGTPLYYALWSNEDHAIADALVAAGADVNAKDNFGETILHRVARNHIEPPGRRMSVVEFLLAAGADIHARSHGGETPLHEATTSVSVRDAHNDGLSMVSLLIAAGSDVNAKDESGATPLHKAALHQH